MSVHAACFLIWHQSVTLRSSENKHELKIRVIQINQICSTQGCHCFPLQAVYVASVTLSRLPILDSSVCQYFKFNTFLTFYVASIMLSRLFLFLLQKQLSVLPVQPFSGCPCCQYNTFLAVHVAIITILLAFMLLVKNFSRYQYC